VALLVECKLRHKMNLGTRIAGGLGASPQLHGMALERAR
jgi:hypothetical protein